MLDSVSPLLININLALMIVVLLSFIGVAVFIVILLRNINRTVESANASAESVKNAAEKASGLLTARTIYRAVKGVKNKKKNEKAQEGEENDQ